MGAPIHCVAHSYTPHPFGPKIEALLQRMVSPIVGLDKTVGFSLHDRGTAGIFVSIAQLTAVHRLLKWPKPLSYHLGGYGLRREEALIRALGETTERYAHMAALLTTAIPRRFASALDMEADGLRTMAFDGWRFFSDEYYATPKAPFRPFSAEAPMTWLETWSILENAAVWVPAQLLVLGYRCRTADGEPWLSPAFTTGTAAHTLPERALNSAILELLQMDAAMGCWYSGKTAPQIELDSRLESLRTLVDSTRCTTHNVCFHYVPSADFNVHVVACVLRSHAGEVPAVAVGTASDPRLARACYKAFLEACAVPHLAQMGFLNDVRLIRREQPIDPKSIGDLDTNVLYYSLPEHIGPIERHFSQRERIAASNLPADRHLDDGGLTRELLDQCERRGIRMYYLELTTPDVRSLGFVVCRVYSPDLLSLSLPSHPPARHPRFDAYGGCRVVDPHPYP